MPQYRHQALCSNDITGPSLNRHLPGQISYPLHHRGVVFIYLYVLRSRTVRQYGLHKESVPGKFVSPGSDTVTI
ncbi:MAG: hypothetical protein BGO09_15120 [Bacteroidetes bacterium 47-18]|nr:MAG: hypothetical protein BGO09_15120 [Bacteroidetes bacterium 47-18]